MRRLIAVVLIIVAGATCNAATAPNLGPLPGAGPIALTNVTVYSPETAPRPGQTVIVAGGTVEQVGPSAETAVPDGARIVDGTGLWVMPALFDMHVHWYERDRYRILGHGITTVRVLWGTNGAKDFAERVDNGSEVGPRAFVASPGHDGHPASWPGTRFVTSPADAVAAVRAVHAEGWPFLKIYDRLSLADFNAMAQTARDEGVPLIGHVPWAVPLATALAAPMRTIEHLSGYWPTLGSGFWTRVPTDAELDPLALATVAAGTWNCPTLAIQAEIARRQGASNRATGILARQAMVRALHRAGARLLLGTDSGIDITAPGAALFDEMDQFLEAGLPADTVLAMATSGAAEFLGMAAEFGRVLPGYRAELLVLSDDPRGSTDVLRAPVALIRGEQLISTETLAAWRAGREVAPGSTVR